jgi:hypothetical protein
LKRLLSNGLAHPDITSSLNDAPVVTLLPPDRIVTGENEPTQLNLFLYQVAPNTALHPSSLRRLREQPIGLRGLATGEAREVRSTITGDTSLAVDLYYVATAYSARNFEIEVLLGSTLQLLHRHRNLDAAVIRHELESLSAEEDQPFVAALRASEQTALIQQLTIEPQFLDMEELSKLWSAFQARYRPSIVYKVVALFADAPQASAQNDGLRRRRP